MWVIIHLSLFSFFFFSVNTAAWTHAVVEWWTHCVNSECGSAVVLTVTAFIVVTQLCVCLYYHQVLHYRCCQVRTFHLQFSCFQMIKETLVVCEKNAAHSFISVELLRCHSAGVNTEVFAIMQLIRICKQAKSFAYRLELEELRKSFYFITESYLLPLTVLFITYFDSLFLLYLTLIFYWTIWSNESGENEPKQ